MSQSRHLLSAKDLSKQAIERIFEKADEIKQCHGLFLSEKKKFTLGYNFLNIYLAFFESSLGTHAAFSQAGKWLGAEVSSFTGLSAEKGERIEDATTRLCGGYPSVVVMRHPHNSAFKRAVESINRFEQKRGHRIALVNAGNGTLEHPVQALSALYTWNRRKKINPDRTRLVCIGDLFKGISWKSLVLLLSNFCNMKSGDHEIIIGPYTQKTGLSDFLREVIRNLGFKIREVSSLDEAIKYGSDADFWYYERLKSERWNITETRHELWQKEVASWAMNPKRLFWLHEKTLVSNPLPRGIEILPECDDDQKIVLEEEALNKYPISAAVLLYASGVLKL